MAGLPSITGESSNSVGISAGSNGALKAGAVGYSTFYANKSYNFVALKFDASWSNSIYGKSDTVTPLSLSNIFLMKY